MFANSAFAQPATYTLTATDSFGDGWNGTNVNISSPSIGTINYTLATGASECFPFTVQAGETVTIQEVNGGFIGEVCYSVSGPSGDQPVIVPTGGFNANTFSFVAAASSPAPVCGEDECLTTVSLKMLDVAGDGWDGSTLNVTVNGVMNTITPPSMPNNTIFAGEGATFEFPGVCLAPEEELDIDVAFTDATDSDNEIEWEITIDGANGATTSDPMGLLVRSSNEFAGGTASSETGTIVHTCPALAPTPAPVVNCGIYEVGKVAFIQAPAAIAECSNGFNCAVQAESILEVPVTSLVAGGTAPGEIAVPGNQDPAASIDVEICVAGDIDGIGFNLEQYTIVIGGMNVVLGGTGVFADQCNSVLCQTVTLPASAVVGGTIPFTTSITAAVSVAGTLCADFEGVTFEPAFTLLEEPSTDAFACITWFATEDTTQDPLFVGNELPFSVIEAQIAAGNLPASFLCHEQTGTVFVTTNCGGQESAPVPVNIFVFNPCTDGCALYVELTDGGADGWEGASLTVSENNGPNQELKLTASDGGCIVQQFCVADGGSLDLQYWEGADNEEHGYNVYDASGNALVTNGPGPSTEVTTAKADCNVATCEGECKLSRTSDLRKLRNCWSSSRICIDRNGK